MPLRDQLLVRATDRTDVPVEIDEPERIDASVVLAQPSVPIDLVLEAVPSEADQRHPVLLQPMHVRPLFVQPRHGLLATESVGLGVHHGELLDRHLDRGLHLGGITYVALRKHCLTIRG
jgi:hypothetical protein